MYQKQTKTSISLKDGDFFDFNRPHLSDFNIETIAHALSNICRYGGHTRKFYSVAEHSVLVSQVVPSKFAMIGLLHDASEAYVGDMPSPLKRMCQSYRTIEERVQEAIAERYELQYPFPESIHLADKRVYLAERQQITDGTDTLWYTDLEPADVTVMGLPPSKARVLFLDRFRELSKAGVKAAA